MNDDGGGERLALKSRSIISLTAAIGLRPSLRSLYSPANAFGASVRRLNPRRERATLRLPLDKLVEEPLIVILHLGQTFP